MAATEQNVPFSHRKLEPWGPQGLLSAFKHLAHRHFQMVPEGFSLVPSHCYFFDTVWSDIYAREVKQAPIWPRNQWVLGGPRERVDSRDR